MTTFSFKLNKTNFVLEWLSVSVGLTLRLSPIQSRALLETEAVVSFQPSATDEQRCQPLWPQLLVAACLSS